jgi:alkanesulfonate monooxygenase SsuD/methylene tetrahydromethanopterin reductase-like flavin-dependent oxidoreductase (luciferase family)
MNFGLFYYCQGRGAPHDQAYAEMLDQIVLAETLGFDECWFAEHHFTDYSLLPSPNLMIASAVQRTQRMRFGNYVNALSFHHPLRLAAEAAMLDNLARGRFDFGVGKGVRLKALTSRVWGGRTYDELEAIGGMVIGSPEQVAEKVAGLEAIGVDTLLLVCSFGNLSHAQVCRSLELFTDAAIRPRPAERIGA